MTVQPVATRRRHGGRQPKDPDPRPQITARVPTAHKERYEREAAALGIPLTDYFAMLAARGAGLDVPAYILNEIQRQKEKREAAESSQPQLLDQAG